MRSNVGILNGNKTIVAENDFCILYYGVLICLFNNLLFLIIYLSVISNYNDDITSR